VDSRARSLRILCVDDHCDSLLAMGRLLRAAGHIVVTADSYLGAKDAAATESFDLLITDVGLRDGDGLRLLAELRARHQFPGIVVSGYDMPDDVKQSISAGFARHFTKPIDFAALTKAIADLVEQPPRA